MAETPLNSEQLAGIEAGVEKHLPRNVAVLERVIPGVVILPTDGKTVKIVIPLADGTATPVFRGKDMLLNDRATDEFAASVGTIVRESYAQKYRWELIDSYLLRRMQGQ